MNIAIIEDEIPAQRMLKSIIEELRPDYNIDVVLDSIESSVSYLKENNPDLIFLDIELSDGISFEIFEQVSVDSFVIFTTAFDTYALKSFELNSIDYVLKPLRKEHILKAIKKFERIYKNDVKAEPEKVIPETSVNQIKYKKCFLFQQNDSLVKVNTEDIAYFYIHQKLVFVRTFSGSEFIADFTLDKLEKELSSSLFFRANRQFILNSKAVKLIKNWFNGKILVDVMPQFEDRIVISREKTGVFKEWLESGI